MIDLIVIGGGINGTAIACDAAGRGLSVLLCERDDLANHTSSASSKLIHGGLRYLEQFELSLVKASLREREILLKKAPHIVWPLQFVMPHKKSIRPAWMIRIGLFLYDHLAGRQKLQSSHSIKLQQHPAGSVLKKFLHKGFIYSDCWGDDARLVVLNAQMAQQHGADIRTRTECIQATRDQNGWQVTLRNTNDGKERVVHAKMLINAAGPWVDQILTQCTKTTNQSHIIHIKGSHIVVPKIHAQDYAYILQNSDQRVIFVIPYLDEYSLIGTTDVRYQNDLTQVAISDVEIDYLCDAVNQYFDQAIHPKDVVWSYAGVRPLKCDNAQAPSKISREYELEVDQSDGLAPILSVFGGKITTHRTLAEHVMEKIAPYFPDMGPAWTENFPLPGGDIPNSDVMSYFLQIKNDYAELPEKLLFRLIRSYGTRCEKILSGVQSIDDLGEHFSADLYQKELVYMIKNEFAQTSEDVLWRRSKLGLSFDKNAIPALNNAIKQQVSHTEKSN